MKLLVDKMPNWGGECPFVEEKWEYCYWTYICKLTNERCDLNLNERECSFLKEQNN